MNTKRIIGIICTALVLATGTSAALAANSKSASNGNPVVRMTTSMGVIDIELYPKKAPKTVKNFLSYVNKGFYNGTTFHRVIAGFMIQGGGFEPGLRLKRTELPIANEANNGLTNDTGTIAMARTGDPDPATAQFFINTADNAPLNHRAKTMQGWGYCVFGKVISGMDVVRKIEVTPTGQVGPFGDVPLHDVIITSAEVVKKDKQAPKK
jgi:peptidyl-prolyl cis-trans isomerase A (cyclophilin A)/peptidyl-prolyl cis-trans isomerase B (cyclophilin B)